MVVSGRTVHRAAIGRPAGRSPEAEPASAPGGAGAMTIIRRANPFDELFTLRRAVDRLFDEDVFHPRTWRTISLGAEPALDITTTPDALLVKASLPGWKPEDVEITLTGSTLTISGEMREEA